MPTDALNSFAKHFAAALDHRGHLFLLSAPSRHEW